MTLENYALLVLKQLDDAKDYPEVKMIITDSLGLLLNEQYPGIEYLDKLQKKIENLSPLTLSSTQFSCYRYALVYLRNYVVLPEKEEVYSDNNSLANK